MKGETPSPLQGRHEEVWFMRIRSVLLRVAVATSTITALTLGAGVTAAHAAPPGISITDASITEGNSGTSTMAFSLQYGGAPTAGVTVDYTTANVTATAGSDYVASSGTIALSATGCKCGTLNIQIIGDTVAENTETFQVNLSNAVTRRSMTTRRSGRSPTTTS